MPESQAAESLTPPVSERDRRLQALSSLADDMVHFWGQSDDQSRSLAWTDGEHEYCLTRGGHAQWSGQESEQQTTWLHVLNPDGEHDTFSMSADSPLAPDAQEGERIAGAMHRHAAAHLFQMARARLGARDHKQMAVRHGDTTVVFQDFTAAEHEPFVWVRVGEMAFDLSPSGFRQATERIQHSLVPQEPHAQIGWLARALTANESTIPDQLLPRRLPGEERLRGPLGPDDISDYSAADFARKIDVMESWSHDNMYLKTIRGRSVLRTVVVTRLGGEEVINALGLVFTKDHLYLEAVSLPATDRRAHFRVDLLNRRASGMIVTGDKTEEGRGEAAATRMLGILNVLDQQTRTDDGLRTCDAETAQLFQHELLQQGTSKPEQQD